MMSWYNPASGFWHYYKPSDLSHRDLRLDRELAALWNWEGTIRSSVSSGSRLIP